MSPSWGALPVPGYFNRTLGGVQVKEQKADDPTLHGTSFALEPDVNNSFQAMNDDFLSFGFGDGKGAAHCDVPPLVNSSSHLDDRFNHLQSELHPQLPRTIARSWPSVVPSPLRSPPEFCPQ